MKDLTTSQIERQNVLNNPFALDRLQNLIAENGVIFNGELVFTKSQVAQLLGVEERTIATYIANYGAELKNNGYRVLKGAELAQFMQQFVDDLNVIHKARSLAIFGFRSVLNLSMLMVESEKAKEIRNRILDVVIDVIAEKTGGHTKYINQRDPNYLESDFQEENYRKTFTAALDKYIQNAGPWKYGKYTNLIYKAIFKENAEEYRQILALSQKDKVRDTFYAEVLDTIASFEAGFAQELEQKAISLGRSLKIEEADQLFKIFSNHAMFKPGITKARTTMASRDMHLRDVVHNRLEEYIKALPQADFERFLGEKSKTLEKHIEEALDVYKRLKDR